MYKGDLALNNLHWLICHNTEPNQKYTCCYVAIFALTYLFFVAPFCSVIRRNSDSLSKFPFFRHVQEFSIEIFIQLFFLPISLSKLLFFCWYLCCLYCFYFLSSVFLYSFLYRLHTDASTPPLMLANLLLPFLLHTYSLFGHFWEFFTWALADDFPLKSWWQQVSSGPQDSS